MEFVGKPISKLAVHLNVGPSPPMKAFSPECQAKKVHQSKEKASQKMVSCSKGPNPSLYMWKLRLWNEHDLFKVMSGQERLECPDF